MCFKLIFVSLSIILYCKIIIFNVNAVFYNKTIGNEGIAKLNIKANTLSLVCGMISKIVIKLVFIKKGV